MRYSGDSRFWRRSITDGTTTELTSRAHAVLARASERAGVVGGAARLAGAAALDAAVVVHVRRDAAAAAGAGVLIAAHLAAGAARRARAALADHPVTAALPLGQARLVDAAAVGLTAHVLRRAAGLLYATAGVAGAVC